MLLVGFIIEIYYDALVFLVGFTIEIYYDDLVFLVGFTIEIYYDDRLCGLVVRVSGYSYRYRGLGFDSRRYQIF